MLLRKLAALIFAVLITSAPAYAIIPTQPYPLYPNTPARANEVQADFSALYNALNGNLDATNFNSSPGAAGIYASQLKPTTLAQGQFGGTATYTFLAGNSGTTPLRISGVTGQTSNLLDLETTLGATPVFSVSASGSLTLVGSVSASMFTAGTPGVQTNAGAYRYGINAGGKTTAVMASNNASGPFGVTSNAWGLFLDPGGVNIASIDTNGNQAVTGRSYAAGFSSGGDIGAAGPIVSQTALRAVTSVQGSTINSAYLNSTTQGIYYAGGNNVASLDYNIASPNVWTLSAPLNVNGGVSAVGTVLGGSVVSQNGITSRGFDVPFDANSTGGSANTHVEHGSVNITLGANSPFGCATIGFARAFSAIPGVMVTPAGGGAVWGFVESPALTTSQVCISRSYITTAPSTAPIRVNWLALGE